MGWKRGRENIYIFSPTIRPIFYSHVFLLQNFSIETVIQGCLIRPYVLLLYVYMYVTFVKDLSYDTLQVYPSISVKIAYALLLASLLSHAS